MLLDTDQDELIIEHTNDVPGVLHGVNYPYLLYTSDAADEEDSVELGGSRHIKKKNDADE